MAKTKKNLVKPVTSLAHLRQLAENDPAYRALLICAAENLGGVPAGDPGKAYAHLCQEAMSVGDEDSIVDEVNFCRDLI